MKYFVQMHYQGSISNNTTEYEGLLTGLRAAIGLDIGKVIIKGGSQLVIKQVNKGYSYPQMAPYVKEVWKLKRRFSSFRAAYVPREENTSEDELLQLASKRELVPPWDLHRGAQAAFSLSREAEVKFFNDKGGWQPFYTNNTGSQPGSSRPGSARGGRSFASFRPGGTAGGTDPLTLGPGHRQVHGGARPPGGRPRGRASGPPSQALRLN